MLGYRYCALEDGFTRSLGLGVNAAPPLGMIVDDLGIYYDASRPSRLEELIKQEAEKPNLVQEARALLHLLSKTIFQNITMPLVLMKPITRT